jgi:hypothetical protein
MDLCRLVARIGLLSLAATALATNRSPCAEGATHWSFQPPRPQSPPATAYGAWIRTPVDAFVLARLEAAGLRPAPPADRATLLRRVTFDLIGLPPTPDETDAFLRDDRPDAYERVVERLLASPHYGERWAQHWLDVTRYAESDGYEADGERTHAWRYRDYVIRSFNEDKPYDRFVTEQLAGDELARDHDPREAAELLVATGFNRCGQVHLVGGNTDREVNRQEVLTEMADGAGAAFLGLTVGCARCHDHKFDPITQEDYYSLQAFFAASRFRDVDIATPSEKKAQKKARQEWEQRVAPLRKKVAALETPYRRRLTETKKVSLGPAHREALDTAPQRRTGEQKKLAEHAAILINVSWDELLAALSPEDKAQRTDWRKQIHELEARRPLPPPAAWAIGDTGPPPPSYVLKRGNPHRKGRRVEPAFFHALAGPADRRCGTDLVGPPARLTRCDLAQWLTRPDHPLTARVFVNRVWQHHFGKGLVATPNDFGLRGTPPSHPGLLDYLAREFVAHGWSVKHLHRLMVLSATYRQAGHSPEAARGQTVDPDNRMLWHMRRSRLEGEALRDAALAVGGELNPAVGGPMVRLPLEPEVYQLIFTEGEPDGLWPVTPDEREHARRSIYLYAKRNVRLPLLEAFDQPDRLFSCPARGQSIFAPQALILLNGPFMQGRAKAFAGRLARECGLDRGRQVERAYRLALGRMPNPAEVTTALAFFTGQEVLLRREGRTPREAWHGALADFCLALLNCNEFLYVS